MVGFKHVCPFVTKLKIDCNLYNEFYVYLVDGIYQFVGVPPNDMPKYFTKSYVLYTLAADSRNKKYTDDLCFFRNVICGRERDKIRKFFNQIASKLVTLKSYTRIYKRICLFYHSIQNNFVDLIKQS